MTTDAGEVERLRARFERERRARRQAEQIAERGMRELWDANTELREGVARRSSGFERLVEGIEFGQAFRLRLIADCVDRIAATLDGDGSSEAATHLDRIRRLAGMSPPPSQARPSDCNVLEITDRLLARWQRPAARNGLLLTFDASGELSSTSQDWSRLVATADALLSIVVRHGQTGSMTASIEVGTHGFVVRLIGAGIASTDQGDDSWRQLGGLGQDLSIVEAMVSAAGGEFVARHDGVSVVEVEARLPRPG